MKKGHWAYRDCVYIAYAKDEFQLPVYVTDTMEEMCDYLGISLSGVSHNIERFSKVCGKKFSIEQVKIYDYVYIIFETDIYHPLYVARDIHSLANKSGCSRHAIDRTLYNRKEKSKKGKELPPCRLKGKYQVKCVDLLDLNLNLAEFLNSCADKETITPGEIEDFNEGVNFKYEK